MEHASENQTPETHSHATHTQSVPLNVNRAFHNFMSVLDVWTQEFARSEFYDEIAE